MSSSNTKKPSGVNLENAKMVGVVYNHNSTNKIGKVNIQTDREDTLAVSTPAREDEIRLKHSVINIDSTNEIEDITLKSADPVPVVAPVKAPVKAPVESREVALVDSTSALDVDEADSADNIPIIVKHSNRYSEIGIEVDTTNPSWAGDALGDLQFVVQDRIFTALKMQLSQRSFFFAQLFLNYPAANRFVIKDMKSAVFEALLAYVQNSRTDSLEENAAGLLVAAQKFGSITLKEKCESILIRQISPSSAIDLLLLADANKAPTLLDKVLEFIYSECPQLVDIDDFNRVTQYKPRFAMEIYRTTKNKNENVN